MYILYTDGKFEYASEDSVLTYTPLQLSDNQSLAMYNGQISTVFVIDGNNVGSFNLNNRYVLTIELSGIITGPCTLELYFQRQHFGNYNITKNMTFNGIQPFSLTIPIYNIISRVTIKFKNNSKMLYDVIVKARVTYTKP